MSSKITLDSICLVIVVIANHKSGSMIPATRIVAHSLIIENENFVIANEAAPHTSGTRNAFELFLK